MKSETIWQKHDHEGANQTHKGQRIDHEHVLQYGRNTLWSVDCHIHNYAKFRFPCGPWLYSSSSLQSWHRQQLYSAIVLRKRSECPHFIRIRTSKKKKEWHLKANVKKIFRPMMQHFLHLLLPHHILGWMIQLCWRKHVRYGYQRNRRRPNPSITRLSKRIIFRQIHIPWTYYHFSLPSLYKSPDAVTNRVQTSKTFFWESFSAVLDLQNQNWSKNSAHTKLDGLGSNYGTNLWEQMFGKESTGGETLAKNLPLDLETATLSDGIKPRMVWKPGIYSISAQAKVVWTRKFPSSVIIP